MYGNKIVFEYLIYLFIPLIFNIICRVNKKQEIIKICSSRLHELLHTLTFENARS